MKQCFTLGETEFLDRASRCLSYIFLHSVSACHLGSSVLPVPTSSCTGIVVVIGGAFVATINHHRTSYVAISIKHRFGFVSTWLYYASLPPSFYQFHIQTSNRKTTTDSRYLHHLEASWFYSLLFRLLLDKFNLAHLVAVVDVDRLRTI